MTPSQSGKRKDGAIVNMLLIFMLAFLGCSKTKPEVIPVLTKTNSIHYTTSSVRGEHPDITWDFSAYGFYSAEKEIGSIKEDGEEIVVVWNGEEKCRFKGKLPRPRLPS